MIKTRQVRVNLYKSSTNPCMTIFATRDRFSPPIACLPLERSRISVPASDYNDERVFSVTTRIIDDEFKTLTFRAPSLKSRNRWVEGLESLIDCKYSKSGKRRAESLPTVMEEVHVISPNKQKARLSSRRRCSFRCFYERINKYERQDCFNRCNTLAHH